MKFIEILNSVLPSPLKKKPGRHKKASKEKFRLNPPSVTSIYFSFVSTNRIKGNGIDKRHGNKTLTGKSTMRCV